MQDGTRLVLREPQPKDVKELMRFYNEVVAEPMNGIMGDKPVNLRQEREWLSARLREIRARTSVMLLLEDDGRIVGSCHVERSKWKQAHRATIGVMIRKDMRRKGLGTLLMREAISLAKKRMKGLEAIDLYVFDYNERALRLYEKLGFETVAYLPENMKEGDRYVGEYFMTLKLRRRE